MELCARLCPFDSASGAYAHAFECWQCEAPQKERQEEPRDHLPRDKQPRATAGSSESGVRTHALVAKWVGRSQVLSFDVRVRAWPSGWKSCTGNVLKTKPFSRNESIRLR